MWKSKNKTEDTNERKTTDPWKTNERRQNTGKTNERRQTIDKTNERTTDH